MEHRECIAKDRKMGSCTGSVAAVVGETAVCAAAAASKMCTALERVLLSELRKVLLAMMKAATVQEGVPPAVPGIHALDGSNVTQGDDLVCRAA